MRVVAVISIVAQIPRLGAWSDNSPERLNARVKHGRVLAAILLVAGTLAVSAAVIGIARH
jgi:hypothetical protein